MRDNLRQRLWNSLLEPVLAVHFMFSMFFQHTFNNRSAAFSYDHFAAVKRCKRGFHKVQKFTVLFIADGFDMEEKSDAACRNSLLYPEIYAS